MSADFPEYLNRHLLTSGLKSQAALARAVGMNVSQMNKIFRGKTNRPELETIEKMARALKRPYPETAAAAGYPINPDGTVQGQQTVTQLDYAQAMRDYEMMAEFARKIIEIAEKGPPYEVGRRRAS